jgi:hypothetical protein
MAEHAEVERDRAIDRAFGESRISRRSPGKAKQACDLHRYHFTKI